MKINKKEIKTMIPVITKNGDRMSKIVNEEEVQLEESYWSAESLITEGIKCYTESRKIQKWRVNEKREMLKGVPIIPITWHNELSKQLWHQLVPMDKRYGQCHSKLRCWYGDSWNIIWTVKIESKRLKKVEGKICLINNIKCKQWNWIGYILKRDSMLQRATES